MSHRFHDLFEMPCSGGLLIKQSEITIGTGYHARFLISGRDCDYGSIIISSLGDMRYTVGKIEILSVSTAARYYYEINETSHYRFLNQATLNVAPFFDHMKENHQEVAEWLLWYI